MKHEAADYEALVGDVHDLRAFALAVDLRSFTAAAKHMGESKATVSRRIARLEAAHIDVALRAATRLPDSALVAHRLLDFEMIAVASPAYLRKHGSPRRPEDLAAHRLVQLGHSGAASTLVLRKADGSGEPTEVRLSYSIAATDVGFAKELVVADAGIAILPRLVAQRDVSLGRLVHLLRPYIMPGAALYLLHRAGRFLPPKVRAFRELMQRELPARCKKQPRPRATA